MRLAAARMIVFGAAGATRRLIGIAAGIALGTGMLLLLLGAFMHMPDRDARAGWMTARGEFREFNDNDELVLPTPAREDVLVRVSADYLRGKAFERISIATTPDTTVEFPGGLEPLKAGEYYASPALMDLIERYPDDELAQRYGTFKGVLPDTVIKGPDQLVVMVAKDWDRMAADPNARVQTGFPDNGPRATSMVYRVILGVGAVALLVPVVLLVGTVSQLGAAARRERYATVRLIGAGRRTMAHLAALEMGVAALVGGIGGIGMTALLRPLAARLPIAGTRSFQADLTAPMTAAVLAIAMLVVLSAGIAWWRSFRDDVGALGAVRERAEKKVSWRRVTLLALGLALFSSSAFIASRGWGDEGTLVLGLVFGFAAITFGIVIAGSWITKVVSSAFARRARSGYSLVAAGRLSRHPRATFRSVAGVVVAVFIVSVLAGVASSINSFVSSRDEPGLLPLNAVSADVEEWSDPVAMVAAAEAIEGVSDVIAVRIGPDAADSVITADEARILGIPDLPDSEWVAVDFYMMLSADMWSQKPDSPRASAPPVGDDVRYVVAVTDGKASTIDRVRTALSVTGDMTFAPVTRAEFGSAATLDITHQLAVLSYIGMAIAVGVSAISLTVATVSAALDRKRTFGLLRLSGMPVRDLRRTIAVEAAMPLGVTLVASAGLGFLVAYVMVLTLGHDLYLTWPDARYWWALIGSVAIAALAVSGSFGMVRRSTEMTSTRFE